MLPNGILSNPAVIGNFIQGKAQTDNLLVDYETGGIALGDSSQGLMIQVWKLEVRNTRDLYVSSPNTSPTFVLSTGYAAQEISLAFDQNMRPTIAYMANNVSYLYWYNTATASQEFLQLPTGSKHPKVTLDDKRKFHTTESDVILIYMRNANIYYRVQRERFINEHLLASNVVGQLLKIGLADTGRIQLQFGIPKTEEEILEEMSKGSPISGTQNITVDDSTNSGDSDLWEFDRTN